MGTGQLLVVPRLSLRSNTTINLCLLTFPPSTQRFLYHVGRDGEAVGFDNLPLRFSGVSSVG